MFFWCENWAASLDFCLYNKLPLRRDFLAKTIEQNVYKKKKKNSAERLYLCKFCNSIHVDPRCAENPLCLPACLLPVLIKKAKASRGWDTAATTITKKAATPFTETAINMGRALALKCVALALWISSHAQDNQHGVLGAPLEGEQLKLVETSYV